MEFHPLPLDEQERFEAGLLVRDTDIPLAVAAMQRLVELDDAGEDTNI